MTEPSTTAVADGFLVRIGGTPPVSDVVWSAGDVAVSASGAAVAERDGAAVAADLRLDNRAVLQGDLGSGTDRDLVLAAVARWGAEAPVHLDGPFSFVHVDGATGRVVAARDVLGRRPLYLARLGGAVALSDRLPRLQALVPPTLCPEAVADALAGDLRRPQTLLAGIERVPAGHLVVVEDGRASIRRFATLTPRPAPDSDAETERAFRSSFDRAVEVRLGDETGAFLSGGLDSSSIVATARALRPEAVLPTFSIVYTRPEADERRFVDAVVGSVGVEPIRVDGDTLSLLGELDGDLRAYGEPFCTPNLFLTRTLYAEAAGQGLGAVLDGFAGDNVVGHGDLWLTDLARSLRWVRFAREARAVASRSSRPWRTASGLVRDYGFRRGTKDATPPISFASALLPAPRPPEAAPTWERAAYHADVLSPGIPRALEVAVASARAHGVDPRFPFADRDLVELCLGLPSDQRLRGGLTRSILRRAMRGRLPPELLRRAGKARLGASFADALFVRDADRLAEIAATDVPAATDVLDVEAVRRAVDRGLSDETARADLALPVWRAVLLARWLTITPRRPTLP